MSEGMSEGVLPEPEFVRLRWTLRFEAPFMARGYLGSAFRGLLGHGLRQTACVTRARECKGCLLMSSCVHARLFEGGLSGGQVPYVLAPPVTRNRSFSPGDSFPLEMTLISPAHKDLAYLVQAFQRAGKLGLGRENVPFCLDDLEWLDLKSGTWNGLGSGGQASLGVWAGRPAAPSMPSRVHVRFITPLRLKRRKQLVGPREFDSALLLEALAYRSFAIAGQRPPKALLETIRQAVRPAQGRLHWADWARYSSRQHTPMKVGGLMGEMVFDTTGLEPWWPMLWTGQWLHLGRFTSMGLGRYMLKEA